LPTLAISTPFPYTTLFRSSLCDGRSLSWWANRPERYRNGASGVRPVTFFIYPDAQLVARTRDLLISIDPKAGRRFSMFGWFVTRSEEHTSELQSREKIVCR